MTSPLRDMFFGSIEQAQRDRRAQLDYEFREGEALRKGQERKVVEIEEGKRKLLEDPLALDKAVSEVAVPWSLGTDKPKYAKFASSVEAVEAAKRGDDPTRGAGFKMRDMAKQVLANPEFRGRSAGELLGAVSEGVMREAGEDGEPLLSKAYRAKRTNDSSFFASGTQELPGYRDWLKDAQTQEAVEWEREGIMASGKEVLSAAAVGAGVGAVFSGGFGAPLGALIGGAAGVVGEMLAAPVRKTLQKSEWYKGQMVSDSWVDKAQGLATAYAPDLLLGGIVQSGIETITKKATTAALRGAQYTVDRKGMVDNIFDQSDMAISPWRRGTKGDGGLGGFFRESTTTPPPGGSGGGGVGEFIHEAEATVISGRSAIAAPTAKKMLEYTDGLKKLTTSTSSYTPLQALDVLLQGAKSPEEVAKIAPIVNIVRKATKTLPKAAEKEVSPGRALLELKSDEAVERALMHPDGPAAGAMKVLDDEKAMVYLVDDVGRAEAMKKSSFEFNRKLSIAEKKNSDLMPQKMRYDGYDEWLDSIGKGKSLNTPEDELIGKAVLDDFIKTPEEALGKIGAFDSPVEDLGKRLPRLDKSDSVRRVIPRQQIEAEVKRLSKGAFSELEAESSGVWLPSKVLEAFDDNDVNLSVGIIKAIMKSEGLPAAAAAEKAKALLAKHIKKNPTFWENEKKMSQVVTGMAAFGVGLGAFGAFDSDKAEAGILSAFLGAGGKGITKEMRYGAMKSLLDKGLISKVVTSETEMSGEFFQRGMKEGMTETIGTFKSGISSVGKGLQFGVMSPYQAFEAALKGGAGKMINPAVRLASFVAAGGRNTQNATQVVRNIFAENGIETARKQVQKAMEPVADLMVNSSKYDVVKARIEQLNKRIPNLEKKVAGERGGSRKGKAYAVDLTNHKEAMQKLIQEEISLRGSTETFHTAWTPIAQDLAQQHASVRVSLALDDTADFVKYPWLKDMLTWEDKVAAGKTRKLLDQYKVRLKERKVHTIKDGYFPHIPHPLVSDTMYARMAENEGLPGVAFAKFYSRTPNSRPMMPDAMTSMEYYLRDVEKRIQFRDFWKGPEGWKNVMLSPAVKANFGLSKAFQNLYEGTKPQADTFSNKLADGYTQFEVFKRLFLNPSAGLKHLVKVTADIASVGPGNFATAVGPALRHVGREGLQRMPEVTKKILRGLGVDMKKFESRLADDFTNSIVASSATQSYVLDMGMENQDALFNSASQLWKKTLNVGSSWISLAEFFDRSVSVQSGLTMALKKGMTVDQSLYGAYDLILKNNFLGREFNPKLLNNPKFRALMMFQATPFKIFERRLVMAQKTKESVTGLSKEMRKVIKDRGIGGVIADLKNMRKTMYDAEGNVKSNLFADTIMQDTDFFGTPIFQQTFRDAATIAAATYAGHSAGLSLYHHFFHIPYLSTQSEDASLAFSPGVNAVLDGYKTYLAKEDEADFLGTEIVRKWLGPNGPIPDIARKIVRLSEHDIPDVYQKGGPNEHLKFLFSVPGYEK